MNKAIKKYIDNGDLGSLRLVFIGALDVDPTFESYEEEYGYCKSIPGFLEQHIELTPFVTDPLKWDEDYWTRLKLDMEKNFSDKRMSHMREVAKVYLAEKIGRIQKEREQATTVPRVKKTEAIPKTANEQTGEIPQKNMQQIYSNKTTEAEKQQEKRMRDDREKYARQYAEEKKKIEEEQKKRHEQALAQMYQNITQAERRGKSSKKVIGIAVAAVIVIVVIVLILVLMSSNPTVSQ